MAGEAIPLKFEFPLVSFIKVFFRKYKRWGKRAGQFCVLICFFIFHKDRWGALDVVRGIYLSPVAIYEVLYRRAISFRVSWMVVFHALIRVIRDVNPLSAIMATMMSPTHHSSARDFHCHCGYRLRSVALTTAASRFSSAFFTDHVFNWLLLVPTRQYWRSGQQSSTAECDAYSLLSRRNCQILSGWRLRFKTWPWSCWNPASPSSWSYQFLAHFLCWTLAACGLFHEHRLRR